MAMENRNKCSVEEVTEEELLLEYAVQQEEELEEAKEKYQKITRAAIARWVQDFRDGHIKIETVDDLKKLIELDLQLQRNEEY